MCNHKAKHVLLIPWGHFAREIGPISGLEAVKLNQKVYEHTLQGKVIEFLATILSGAKYLQEISLAAHPLDKDLAVAEAWGPSGRADYTGVSRTLKGMSWEEAQALVAVLERVSQLFWRVSWQCHTPLTSPRITTSHRREPELRIGNDVILDSHLREQAFTVKQVIQS
ncbi:MAG: hypothetical protein AB1345_07015 [Chloroflexota bacterium]